MPRRPWSPGKLATSIWRVPGLGLALCLAASLGGARPSDAAAAVPFCAPAPRECARVVVPLDRSGRVPDSVALQVERQRPRHRLHAPLVVLAPLGVSATQFFDPDTLNDLLGAAGRHRDLIVFDERGTGNSGVIRCRRLERSQRLVPPVSLAPAAAACARHLGARRAFYSVGDSVEDLEAVRAAIDAPRIAILAVSDGSNLALRYAQQHPQNVERLMLDSPAPLGGRDPLYRSAFRAAPRVMRAFCAVGACRPVTRHPADDLTRLATRLRRHSVRGRYFDGFGRAHTAVLRPFDLLRLVTDEDARGGMPAAIRAALRGDNAPMVRAEINAQALRAVAPPATKVVSAGAAAATTCEDADLPWPRAAPIADRERAARARVHQLGNVFGAFGPDAALGSDVLDLCKRWPAGPPSTPAAPTARLPAVPSLLISGNEDLTAPREDTRRLTRLIPGSRLLRISGWGHLVLFAEDPIGSCVARAVRAFLETAPVRDCPRPPNWVSIVTLPFPRALSAVRPVSGVRGRAGRTLAAMHRTLADLAETTYVQVLLGDSAVRAGGLRGGYATISEEPDRFRLHGIVFVPGVRISGTLAGFVYDEGLRGRLRVSGPGAAHGTLVVHRRRVTGRLGGRRIDVRMALDQDSLAAADEVP